MIQASEQVQIIRTFIHISLLTFDQPIISDGNPIFEASSVTVKIIRKDLMRCCKHINLFAHCTDKFITETTNGLQNWSIERNGKSCGILRLNEFFVDLFIRLITPLFTFARHFVCCHPFTTSGMSRSSEREKHQWSLFSTTTLMPLRLQGGTRRDA